MQICNEAGGVSKYIEYFKEFQKGVILFLNFKLKLACIHLIKPVINCTPFQYGLIDDTQYNKIENPTVSKAFHHDAKLVTENRLYL